MVLTRHYLFVFRTLTVVSKVRKRKFDTLLGTSAGSLISFPGKGYAPEETPEKSI